MSLDVAAQPRVQMSLEQAKAKVQELVSNLSRHDGVYSSKIETELKRSVSTSPKDEFETTQEYQARLKRAATLRNELTAKYSSEKNQKRTEIQNPLTELFNLEFAKPVNATLGTYDADTESFPATVHEIDSGQSYEEPLSIPRTDARTFKEGFSELSKKGLFGIVVINEKPVEYYFGLRVDWKGQQISSLPPKRTLTANQLTQYYPIYNDPFVIHIRKTLDRYLAKPNVEDEEFEELKEIDRDYLRSKFIVFSINPHLGGGKAVEIVFADKPDARFRVWVYRFAEGGFDLRSFEISESDPREMKRIRIRYRVFFQDRLHSL